MKIEYQNKSFNPVALVLETQEDLERFRRVIGAAMQHSDSTVSRPAELINNLLNKV